MNKIHTNIIRLNPVVILLGSDLSGREQIAGKRGKYQLYSFYIILLGSSSQNVLQYKNKKISDENIIISVEERHEEKQLNDLAIVK